MSVTKTLAHSGANTATWLISGPLELANIPPFLEGMCFSENPTLARDDFEQLPTGQLRDVLLASYSSAPPSPTPDTAAAADFMVAFGGVGGSVSVVLGNSGSIVGLGEYGNPWIEGYFKYVDGSVQFVLRKGIIGTFTADPQTGYAVLKMTTNYSAGR